MGGRGGDRLCLLKGPASWLPGEPRPGVTSAHQSEVLSRQGKSGLRSLQRKSGRAAPPVAWHSGPVLAAPCPGRASRFPDAVLRFPVLFSHSCLALVPNSRIPEEAPAPRVSPGAGTAARLPVKCPLPSPSLVVTAVGVPRCLPGPLLSLGPKRGDSSGWLLVSRGSGLVWVL